MRNITLHKWKEICAASGFRGEIRIREAMWKHTSFAIGGPADLFVIPASGNDLIKLINFLRGGEIIYRILGGGTNLLVSDQGVRGVVIQLGRTIAGITFQGNRVTAEAGLPLTRLARKAAKRGLSGLEFAAGIPGTVGGAVVMNAGCGGGDISSVARRVRTIKTGFGLKDRTPQECRFGYRSSRFRGSGEVILEVECELRPDSLPAIRERMDMILVRRKATLPLDYPSAGSIFKNPPGDYAGRLIEAAGLKGRRGGGAQISERHANIIVNLGSARSKDVEGLIALAREKVKERFRVFLELEIDCWEE